MARAVTLFTGQWADLPLEELAGKCGCWAIGNHLVGQAVCDPIDSRHQGVLSPEIWGDGDPEGVRQRAAEAMKDTARAAAQLGVDVVTGFTGSPTWHMLYSFPPNDFDEIERGYQEFAERWGPIIDVFEAEGVRFALEVHPTEIAYDFVSMIRALNRIGYNGPLSIEWEDSGMDRDWGAPDALAFVRRTDFAPSSVAFDAAFAKES